MSVTEQIAALEQDKLACMQQFDEQIMALKLQQFESANGSASDAEEVVLPNGRRLIRSRGRSLSQIIIEDRGSY